MSTLALHASPAPQFLASVRERGTIAADRAYLGAWIVALGICWCPGKAYAYLAPLLALIWFMLASRQGIVVRRVVWAAAGYILFVLAHMISQAHFELPNACVFAATYSSFLFLIAIPNRLLARVRALPECLAIARAVVVFEASFGIVQAVAGYFASGTFDVDNGDTVQGTIFPHLRPDNAFGNPMFGASMTLLLIGLLAGISSRRASLLPLCIGTVSLVLASVLHQLIFLAIAFGVAYFLIRPKLPVSRGTITVLVVATTIPGIAVIALPGNIGTFNDIATQFLRGESPRAVSLRTVFTEMASEYPFMPVVGVGPGQFCSRAALMSTGYYFGGLNNPRVVTPAGMVIATPLREYLLQLWLRNVGYRYYGSSQKPFFSWLSVYTELGGLAVIALTVIICRALLRLRRTSRALENRMPAFAAAAGILFIVLLGFQENYWEVPQAIFPGFVLLKLLYANCTSMPAQRGGFSS